MCVHIYTRTYVCACVLLYLYSVNPWNSGLYNLFWPFPSNFESLWYVIIFQFAESQLWVEEAGALGNELSHTPLETLVFYLSQRRQYLLWAVENFVIVKTDFKWKYSAGDDSVEILKKRLFSARKVLDKLNEKYSLVVFAILRIL